VGKKNRRIKNKQFNRFEKGGHHQYVEVFSPPIIKESKHSGTIKCKLVHGLGYSIIVPDLLFLLEEKTRWIQPLFFTACSLSKFDDRVECRFAVDISHGHRLFVNISSKGFIRYFDDGSELFTCEIQGPENLKDYCTGTFEDHDEYHIPLFHHTNKDSCSAILKSKYFRSSTCNFQGTNEKELTNVNYTYFTCIDSIRAPEDLNQIAMASAGKIALLRDNGSPNNPNDIVVLEVYRGSTTNRTHPIKMLIPISLIAPSHLIKHFPFGEPVYYQVMNPFIYRIGLLPGGILPFESGAVKPDPGSLKRFEYVVIGNGTEREGLIAPFDEENTKNILKIQKTNQNSNILEFWFKEGNKDLFTNKDIEFQEFQTNIRVE
jgi:hypothetical protein